MSKLPKIGKFKIVLDTSGYNSLVSDIKILEFPCIVKEDGEIVVEGYDSEYDLLCDLDPTGSASLYDEHICIEQEFFSVETVENKYFMREKITHEETYKTRDYVLQNIVVA